MSGPAPEPVAALRSVATLRSMIAWDARLQVRYGLYAVYAVLTALFVVGVRLVDPALRTDVAVLLIVADPTLLGFYFIAAMVLFESGEGVLDAIVLTPLGATGYLLSKTLTLAGLATAAATAVAVLGHGATPRTLLLVVGVALSASLFVLLGFVAVARFDSVNEYFLSAVGWGSVLFVPLVGSVGLLDTPLFYAFPTQATLVLVEAGFRPIEPWKLAYGGAYLLVGNAVAIVWARRSFSAHVVRGHSTRGQFGRTTVYGTDADADRPVGEEGHPGAVRRASAPRSPVVALVVADLRNWLRDPLLAMAAVGPFVLAVVLRFGVPFAASMLAPAFDPTPYYPVVAGADAVFGPSIYGFIVGMFVLEDRELGVYDAFRTSPVGAHGYLAYRGGTAAFLGFASTVPALAAVGLVPLPASLVVGAAVCSALGAPLVAFALGLLADNTIEGLALSKFVNAVVLGPALLVAVVPEPLQFVVGVAPTYWPVKVVEAGATGSGPWIAYLIAGVVAHAVVLAVLVRRFATSTR